MLQNTIPPGNSGNEQPAALAIGVSNEFFKSRGNGVSRIHGGGFAGTIQVFMPKKYIDKYRKLMEHIFGDNSLVVLKIRSAGSMYLGKMILDTLD